MKIGIEGGLIIAFNGTEHRLIENGVVVFEGDTIVHVGKSYSGNLDRKIEAKKRLVIPARAAKEFHYKIAWKESKCKLELS